MQRMLEDLMTKRLGRSPKQEACVSVQAETKALLWAAVPRRMGDNVKSWTLYAAHQLGWNPRRVRAIWNEEARVIRAEEWTALNEKLADLTSAAERRGEAINELQTMARAATAQDFNRAGPLGVAGDEPSQEGFRAKR